MKANFKLGHYQRHDKARLHRMGKFALNYINRYMSGKTCYICYIAKVEAFTVLHFVLQDVTPCYVNGNVFSFTFL
jgi:hypothetical protein